MEQPLLETLEMRTLLSAVTLATGRVQLFDFDADGRKDAILVNTGTSDIQYDYSGGNGLDAVLLTADGGKFTTNMFVSQVGDVSNVLDFNMGSSKIGVSVRYGGTTFSAIEGNSSVIEGSLSQLEIGRGNLLNVQATTGNIGKVYVDDGNLTNAAAVGSIDSLVVVGDILGTVSAGANIGTILANHLSAANISATSGAVGRIAVNQIDNGTIINVMSIGTINAGAIGGSSSVNTQQGITKLQAGTISDASINVGGSVGSLIVDTLSGTVANSTSTTSISILGHVGKFQAQLITGGDNGALFVDLGAGVDTFTAGQMDGGTATGGNQSGAYVSVSGNIGRLSAGFISGGWANGDSNATTFSLSVNSYTDANGNVQLGDIGYMNVSAMSGGSSSNGGYSMLYFTVANDLVNARIGQMIGSDSGSQSSSSAIYFTAWHNIDRLVVGRISGGSTLSEIGKSSVNIGAGNDLVSLTAGQIDGGSAIGDYSTAVVYVIAGHDINSIVSGTFSGGQATGDSAQAGLVVQAARNIDFIGANLISGTQARMHITDPTVRFEAGGDIGTVLAGRITGGNVNADGTSLAQASILIQAYGAYVDENGAQSAGDIGTIVTGTIDGGSANGTNALSYVKIAAAHDIDKIYSDQILGGQASNGGFTYVSITAGHDINSIQAGLISGVTGGHHGCDPVVLIQACNDIKSLVASQIIAGINGSVDILAGIDANGNVSGELDANGNLIAGSIENMIVGLISGNGGIVNIAAGGDIENLRVCRIVSGNGEVNIVAGGDITASVGSVQSWHLAGETGVEFMAGGAVNDVRNSISAEYTEEGMGSAVEFPEIPVLPEGV